MRKLALRLLSLAWPVALARLGIMGMGVVDAIVVGQLAPDELPHQALGWAPTGVLLVTSVGLLTGVQVLVARSLGADQPEHAGGALQCGLIVSLVSGALANALALAIGEHAFAPFGVAPELVAPAARVMRVLMFSVPAHLVYTACAFFVEGIERPLVSTWFMTAANVVNLVMNLWLVPRYGAIGSAWATVCARTFLAIGLLAWIFGQKDAARLGLRRFSVGAGFRAFFGIGFAAALSQAAEASAFSGMTLLAGRLGGQAVSAYQIMLNLLALVFMVSLGLATATAVLASQASGRRLPREAATVSWIGLAVNTAIMLAVSVLLLGFVDAIARAYTSATDVALLVVSLMPLVASAIIVDGGQTVVASALRAQRDNWMPTASHLLAYALVMPGLALFFSESRGLGVRGLLLAINWASALSVAVLMVRLRVVTQRARRELQGA